MLKIQEFIRDHKDWRDLIVKEPYFIGISEKTMFGRNMVLLKYSQRESDFTQDIVRECRGLILDADTNEVICHPFEKFFNLGEPCASEIDWSTAFVSEKLDGSIIKVVRLGDDYLISTNGTIDAFGCSLMNDMNCPFSNFGELFLEGMKYYGLSKIDFPGLFEEGYTYMFELTSPYNQVVVQFPVTKVNLIGIRHNASGQEIRFADHALAEVFDIPKVFSLHSADECVAAANALPDNNEGYVVCDAQFRRVKIKSPKYVQLHYMASNQVWSPSRVIDIVRANEVDEYVAYFPKFKDALDAFKQRYDSYVDSLKDLKVQIDQFKADGMSKKDFALWLMGSDKKVFMGFAFKYFDGKVGSVQQFMDELDNNRLCVALGL